MKNIYFKNNIQIFQEYKKVKVDRWLLRPIFHMKVVEIIGAP